MVNDVISDHCCATFYSVLSNKHLRMAPFFSCDCTLMFSYAVCSPVRILRKFTSQLVVRFDHIGSTMSTPLPDTHPPSRTEIFLLVVLSWANFSYSPLLSTPCFQRWVQGWQSARPSPSHLKLNSERSTFSCDDLQPSSTGPNNKSTGFGSFILFH